MNRGVRIFLKVLLVLATVAGLVFAVWIIRQDEAETAERQEAVDELEVELRPLLDERAEWKEKDSEWKKKLDEKIKGESCMLISIDNMDKNLYDTIYMMMAPYGMRATFSLKGGHTLSDPEAQGKEKEYIDTEQFQEMQDMGWEYAVSVDSQEDGEPEEETEEESEEESEGELSYLERLDAALQGLENQGLEKPKTVFLEAADDSEEVKAGLIERGFVMENVVSEKTDTVIGEKTEDIYRIDSVLLDQSNSVLLDQNNSSIEKVLDQAAINRQSLAITVKNVTRITKENDTSVSLTVFSSFLNRLRMLEEQGYFKVMTYSEFNEYQKQREKDKVRLTKKYSEFKSEMKARLEEIEKEEQEIVARVMQIE